MKKIGLISSAFLLTLALAACGGGKVQKIRIVVPVLRKVPHSRVQKHLLQKNQVAKQQQNLVMRNRQEQQ